jgi:nucleotide-binding universal stress UspA family protein
VKMTNPPIVVPLDGSKNSVLAVPAAVALSKLYESPLAFVHVAPVKLVADGPERARAQQVFEDFVHGLASAHGLERENYEAVLLRGSAAGEVLRYAESCQFIVIATHGRGGFRAAIIGSVADKVVRGATSPVVLLPIHGETDLRPERPIVVAVDGSRAAEAGLALARDLAARSKQEVMLVRAYDLLPSAYVDITFYPVDLLGVEKEAATEYLQKTALKGEKQVLVEGRPDVVIPGTAESLNAGILVLSTNGLGLARRIALGSTTDRMMRETTRPLLIVPAGMSVEAESGS